MMMLQDDMSYNILQCRLEFDIILYKKIIDMMDHFLCDPEDKYYPIYHYNILLHFNKEEKILFLSDKDDQLKYMIFNYSSILIFKLVLEDILRIVSILKNEKD